MARPAREGGKRSAAKTRKVSPAKGRTRIKAKRPARLKRSTPSDIELKEVREQQTATAEILKVIASSPSDVLPVFEAIVGSAKRLLGGFSAAVFRFKGGIAHLEAITPTNPAADAIMRSSFPRPVSDFHSFAMAYTGKIVQTPDTEALLDDIRDIARARGFRSMLIAPLLREGAPIGLISVTRVEPGSFSANFVHLLQTFADQAVIAIENTRLFNEVKARTEELSEALTHQTGSANILRVIASSPTDIQPVLDAIVRSAWELCEAYDAVLVLKEGEELFVGSHYGRVPLNRNRWPNDRSTISGRAVSDRRSIHVADISTATGEFPTAAEMSVRDGGRTVLGVPLMREGTSIGAIVLRRTEVDAFSDKQVALLQTFAAQAVIAI
ncbi:MAG TPA: GAF domain-containing protein, partial [Blastocatellia bacterium]|nr:GAF domain-containing protein [Blastocatellia bacterium]